MQTDIVCAWQVEGWDVIAFPDGTTAEIADIEDDGDESEIRFFIKDEDGFRREQPILRFPMETVNIVTSWDDPDDE